MTEKNLNLIILGPPGSGKGTQAFKIAQKFNLKYISTGEYTRKLALEKSSQGELIKKYLKKGQLIPNEIIDQFVKEEVEKTPLNQGIVFDGYPRDLPQAKFLENVFTKNGRKMRVIYLDVSEEESTKRILSRGGRKSCQVCGTDYGVDYPKNKCPHCGSSLVQRIDDTPTIVKKRFREFLQKTKPVIEFFKNKEGVILINGEQSIEKVFKDIIKRIR